MDCSIFLGILKMWYLKLESNEYCFKCFEVVFLYDVICFKWGGYWKKIVDWNFNFRFWIYFFLMRIRVLLEIFVFMVGGCCIVVLRFLGGLF